MATRAPAALLLAVAAMLGAGSAAEASCVAPVGLSLQLSAAPVAFVGSVVATADNGRQARVKVESVWKGPRLPEYVNISGSPAAGTRGVTSVDRGYEAGGRYLFVPVGDQRPFQDNICTATQLYTTDVAANAPAGARGPDPALTSDPDLAGSGWLASAPLIGGALVVALLAAAAVAGRRRRVAPRSNSG